MMPWEAFLQLALFALFMLGIVVLLLMYLDGYWSVERVDKRRLEADTFSALDRRHQLKRNQK